MVHAIPQFVNVVEKLTFFELDFADSEEIIASHRDRGYSDFWVDYSFQAVRVHHGKEDIASDVSTVCGCGANDVASEFESIGCSSLSWASDDEGEVVFPHNIGCVQTPQPSCARKDSRSRGNLAGEWTTLIVKNLPTNLSQEALYELMNFVVFAGSFDLLYAPVNFRTGFLFGYCFVNFCTHDIADIAMQQLRDFDWSCLGGQVVEVQRCDSQQGIDAQIDRFRNCPVMHQSVPLMYKPILLQNGQRIPFPKPTKKVSVPKEFSNKRQQAHRVQ